MARPSLEIDQEKFEELCRQHMSKAKICKALHVSDARTIDKWCKRVYSSSFSEVLEQKETEGEQMLIKDAYELAKKNGAVMIFLLKNWCGMTDTPKETGEVKNGRLSEMDKALEELFFKKEQQE